MRLGSILGVCGVAAAASVGATAAQAAPVTFELQSALVAYNQADPGVAVGVTVLDGGPPAPFTLDEGESYTFTLFHIHSTEFADADDSTPRPLDVTLGFANLQSVFVQGTAYAIGTFTGVADFEPLTVTDGDLVYTVTLSDATFIIGPAASLVQDNEPSDRGIVTATISRPAAAIPTPAAAGLGLAMLGGLVARRRRG